MLIPGRALSYLFMFVYWNYFSSNPYWNNLDGTGIFMEECCVDEGKYFYDALEEGKYVRPQDIDVLSSTLKWPK